MQPTWKLITFTLYTLLVGLSVGSVVGQNFLAKDAVFYIEPNTFVSIETESNEFNASIQGEGTLLFSGKNRQHLHNQAYIQLPNVKIQTQYSFTFYNPLLINGSLTVQSQELRVNADIYVKQSLAISPHTKVFGEEFLHHQPMVKPLSIPFQNYPTTPIVIHVQNTKVICTIHTIRYKEVKPSYHYTEIKSDLLALAIPTPPPEYRG